MEFMNDVMGIDVSRMSRVMRRVTLIKETDYHLDHKEVTIDKENNVLLFKECYYYS